MDESARDMHYSRNRYNNPLPQNIDEAKDWGWVQEKKDYCHQFGIPAGAKKNVKYIPTEDGREQIFTSDDVIETSPENIGTFNYFHPQKQPISHIIFDVLPWYFYGNTPYDTTTPLQRIWRSLNLG